MTPQRLRCLAHDPAMKLTGLRLTLISCLWLALASLAAAAKTDLVIWGQAITPNDKGLDALVREFEARNPDIRVRMLGMGAGAMNPQKLMTAIVGGVPPDVIRQDRFSLSDWAHRGAFRSLDDLIARDLKSDPTTPKPQDYYPAAWSEAIYEGKVYGIPIGADNRVLYYNKKIFREMAGELRAAGLDPERPPRTWSETLAYSKVLTQWNPDGTLKRAGFMPNFGNSWLYLYSFQNNASFLSPDGRTCTINSPEVKQALEFMIAGYDILGGAKNSDKFQASFKAGEDDPFLSGRVAMVINGDWVLSGYFTYAPRMDFGTAPPPVPDDRFFKRGRFADEKDTFITWAGGFAYAIPRDAKNLEAAWKWIKFSCSTEGRMIEMRAQNEMEKARGRRYIPRVLAHREANELSLKEFASGTSSHDAALHVHIGMMPFARTRPASFAAQLLWDEHVRSADQAMRKFQKPQEALDEAQKKVQRILDEVNETEKFPVADLRIPALAGVVAIVLAVGGGYWLIRRMRLGRIAGQEAAAGYLFISPWIIGFLVFTLGPMLASLFFSFTQYNVLNEPRWVGLKNYQDLFQADAPILMKAFGNVLYLAGVGIPLGMVTAIGVALLLNTGVKGMRFYRTAFYLPAIVTSVASLFLWLWLLNPDPTRGLINSAWQASISQWFGTEPPGWLSAEEWAKPALILQGLWGAGSGMILWLAGLKGISGTLYEAASIDGATSRQQFFTITLPQLSPLIFFSSVMGFIGALQTFDNVYIITGGLNAGPNDSLAMPVYYLFNNAFNYFRMGYASALAWTIFAIIIIITLIQFKIAPRWVHYEVEK